MEKKKVLISILAVLLVSLLVGIIVLATTTGEYNYATEVIDDGSGTEVTSVDNDAKFQTVIKVDESTDTELVYETTVTNLTGEKNKNVCIFIDTSYSIAENAEFNKIKEDAKSLVERLFSEVGITRITIATNEDCNIYAGSNAKNGALNFIDGRVSNNTGSIEKGLENVKDAFEGVSGEKYTIIYSDATDSVKTKLEEIESKDIKIYSVLTNITSTSFGTVASPIPSTSTVYMMDSSYDNKNIVDDINKTITDVKLYHEFNPQILLDKDRGNFKVDIIDATGTATQLTDGKIEWVIGNVGAGNPAKLKFKLKLNTTSPISSYSIYENIDTIKTSMSYKQYNGTTDKTFGNDKLTSPTIQICDAYDVKIKAIGEKTKDVIKEDITFDVEAIKDGSVLTKYCKTGVVADSNGEIIIPRVKELGKITFNITAHVNKVEYKNTTNMTVEVENIHNSDGTNTLTVNPTPKDLTNISGKRNIEVNVTISEEKFKVTLDLSDYNYDSMKLEDRTFALIMPTDSILKRDALEATTDSNGKCTFEVPVKGVAGKYTYILEQKTTKGDYKKAGNPSITIEFDNNGNVVKMTDEPSGILVEDSEYVRGEWVNEKEISLIVKNKTNNFKTYKFLLNLSDGTSGIGSSNYSIRSKQSDIDCTFDNKITDVNGNIELDIPYKEEGFINIWVKEVEMNSAYKSIADMTVGDYGKQYTFYIKGDGTIDLTRGSVSSGELSRDSAEFNKVKLALNTTKKPEQNVVKIKLQKKNVAESQISGVDMVLKNSDNPSEVYTATTDSNGIATFTLPTPDVASDGAYNYNINVDNSTLLPGMTSAGAAPLRINFVYGKINDCENVNASVTGNPLVTLDHKVNHTMTEVEYTVEGIYEVESKDENKLQIKLTNREDPSETINDGKYTIIYTYDSHPSRVSVNAKTDASGLTNELPFDLDDGEVLTIEIEQNKYDDTTKPYCINNNTYVIKVEKDGSGIKFSHDSWENANTVKEGTNKIILNDTNKKVDLTDVIYTIDLTKYLEIITSTESGNETVVDANTALMIWSDQEDGENDDYTLVDCSTGIINDGDKQIVKTDGTGNVVIKLKPRLTNQDADRNNHKRTIHIAEYDMVNHEMILDDSITNSDGTHPAISISITSIYTLNEAGNGWVMQVANQLTGSMYFVDKTTQNNDMGIIDGAHTYSTTATLTTKNMVGNLAIDFKKYSAGNNGTKNELDSTSYPAKYIVTVTSPSGSTREYATIVDNETNKIELEGVFVRDRYIVDIKEEPTGTPSGYECDEEGESFVAEVDQITGAIKLKRTTDNSNPVKIVDSNLPLTASKEDKKIITPIAETGTGRFIAQIDLINSELNELPMGIKTVDKDDTEKGLEGNTYNISSSSGAQVRTKSSDKKGKISTQIGGNKASASTDPLEMIYTITQNVQETQVTKNYKRISGQIDVKVYFDQYGNVIDDPSSPYYWGNVSVNPTINDGKWGIEKVNDDDGNRIDIIIYKEKADPLQVNITTKDKFTKEVVNNVATYEITPSESDVIAQGTSNFNVGYIQEGTNITYTLITTLIQPNNNPYQALNNQQFSLTYTNDGKVIDTVGANGINVIGSNIEVTRNALNDQAIDIVVYLEPAVVFQINNKEYFGTNSPISGATFSVIDSNSNASTIETTNTNGETKIYYGKYGNSGTTASYTIHQDGSSRQEIAKIKDFLVNVSFGDDGEITDASLASQTSETDLYNAGLVEVTWSKINDNGVSKWAVIINIKSYPSFRINITNIEKGSDDDTFAVHPINLAGSDYNVTSSIANTVTNPTDGYGKTVAYLDRTEINGSITYSLSENTTPYGYQILESGIDILVNFDNKGYVDTTNSNNVRIINSGTSCGEVGMITTATSANPEEFFTINLIVKNAPKFRVNIKNVDKVDTTKQLDQSDWKVYLEDTSSQINTGTTTLSDYVMVPVEDVTPISDYAIYVIKNTKASPDYQLITNKTIKIKVNFDENGYVDVSNPPTIVQGEEYVLDSIPFEINPPTCSTDRFAINITIKSAPKTKVNITNVDREHGTVITGGEWSVELEGAVGLDGAACIPAVATTSGLTAASVRVDGETPINATGKYIIKNTVAAVGYQRIEEPIEIEVKFDSNGYIDETLGNSALKTIGSRTYCVDKDKLLIVTPRILSVDYYTFDITIISTPLSSIRIKNIGRSDGIELSNSEWRVKLNGAKAVDGSELTAAPNIITNASTVDGYVLGNVNGETPFNGSATYTIENINGTNNYQKLSKNIEVTINFVEGKMDNIINTVKDGDTEVELYKTPITLNDYLTFDIKIKTSPKIKVYIENLDRRDDTTLVNSVFDINTVDQNSVSAANTGITKATTDMVTQLLDGDTGINSTVTYTISQPRGAGTPDPEFQTIDPNVIKIKFNEKGEIIKADLANAVQDTYTRDKKIITVEEIDTGDANLNNFALKITIKNNPLIAINVTVKSMEGTPILGAQINTESENQTLTRGIENVYTDATDVNGKLTFHMDKAIDNTTIQYRYVEEQAPGYEKLYSTFAMETKYTDEGKISGMPINTTMHAMGEAGKFVITAYTDFSIDITILNEELSNFKIQVNTVDYWDKVEGSNYMYQQNGKAVNNARYIVRVLKDNYSNSPELDIDKIPSQEIQTGNVSGTNIYGFATTDFGGNAIFGTTESGEKINSAVIELTETQAPNEYYSYDTGECQESNYYSITQNNGSGTVSKKIRIAVNFDENGKIIKATVMNNPTAYTGIYKTYCPKEFLEISDYTEHTLKIRIKYVPSLSVTVNAVSAYGDILDGDNLEAKYAIKTRDNSYRGNYYGYNKTVLGYNYKNGVGKVWQLGRYKTSESISEYDANTKGMLIPIEPEKGKNDTVSNGKGSRIFYIYEPLINDKNKLTMYGGNNNTYKYQQMSHYCYSAHPHVYFNGNLLAKILVNYNEKGEIDSYSIMETDRKGTLNAYSMDFGKAFGWKWLGDRSNKDYEISINDSGEKGPYIDVSTTNDKHEIQVTLKYKRITSLGKPEVVDATSGAALKGIEFNPWNTTADGIDKKSYTEYAQGNNKFTSDANGILTNSARPNVNILYWGGISANAGNMYKLENKNSNIFTSGKTYEGYTAVNDVDINAQYDENGIIKEDSTITSINSLGQANAEVVNADKSTNDLNMKILVYRHYNLKLNSVDKYDNSATSEQMEYNVITKDSSGNTIQTLYNVSSNNMFSIMSDKFPGETITYEITQAKVPELYRAIDPCILKVTYYAGTTSSGENVNGKIAKITLDDPSKVLYDGMTNTINTIPESTINIKQVYDFEAVKTSDSLDLEMDIKHIPLLAIDITARNEFYYNETLPDVEYEVTNTKGDTQTITTDSNGNKLFTIGELYPSETVTYTIHQKTRPVAGYYERNDIVITVKFSDTGAIDYYTVDSGDLYNIISASGQKKIVMDIYNKPRDVIMTINKFDEETKENLSDVKFEITRQTSDSVETVITDTAGNSEFTTNTSGNILLKVDEFEEHPTAVRDVIYTVREKEAKPSYRKIDEIKFRVHYGANGRIEFINDINVPTEANIYQGATGKLINVVEKALDGSDISAGKAAIGVKVSNDNRYDIIIKNEDIDSSAGIANIEGTKYDIGITEGSNTTNTSVVTGTNGFASKIKNDECGDITISISENTIGTGYRSNLNNHVEFEIHKDTKEYTLELKKKLFINETTTNYIINSETNVTDPNYGEGIKYVILGADGTTQIELGIYEETGKIVVLFKNESKSEIIVDKIDASTVGPLEGAQFYIKKQEIDDYGSPVGSEEEVKSFDSTINSSDATTNTLITNVEGKAKFDIGTRPRNKTIKYTFKELTAPVGFDRVEDFEVIVKYDSLGNISIPDTDGISSLRVDKVDSRFDIEVVVKNGSDPEGYYVKIVSEDSEMSGNKIDGSQFDITIKDGSGNIVQTITNMQTAPTPNSFGITENGVICVGPITTEGNISIEVNQTGYVDGYVQGTNATYGIADVNVKFVETSPGSTTKVPEFSKINYTYFADNQIELLDKRYKEIKIHVKNEPQTILNIHKVSTVKDKDGNEVVVPGVEFTITSEIDNGITTTPTDLNVSGKTNTDGDLSIPIGKAVGGKTVIYKISESETDGYEKLQDMYLAISYNTNGSIRKCVKLYNPETDEFLEMQDGYLNNRHVDVKISNVPKYKDIEYKIVVQTQTPDGTKLIDIPVGLEVDEEVGEMNVTYFPENHISQTSTSNPNIAETPYYTGLKGYGDIRCYITIKEEDEIKLGWQFDDNLSVGFYKDKMTGNVSSNASEINASVDLSEYDSEHLIRIIINPKGMLENQYHTIIYKQSSSSGTTIVNNPATFTLVQYGKDEDTSESSSGTTSSTAVKYKITFDKNTTDDVNNMPSEVEYEESNEIELPNQKPTRTGYVFIGWDEDKDKTEDPSYGPGDEVGDDRNITLYAIWKAGTATTYKVTFDKNTSELVNDIPSEVEYDEFCTTFIPSQIPTRTNYVFIGWDEDKNKTEDPSYGPGDEVGDDRNITLYAIWQSGSTYFTGESKDIIRNETTGDAGMIDVPALAPGIGTYKFALKEETSPDGYKGLESTVALDITFDKDPTNPANTIITNVESHSSKVKCKTAYGGKILYIYVENDEDIGDDEYQLNIYKIDADTVDTEPATQLSGALFKVILPDTLVTGVYMESGENQTVDMGRLEYSYIEENKENPSVRLSHMKKPTIDEVKASPSGTITREYTLIEKASPDGYAQIPVELKLEVDFKVITEPDGTEKVLITAVRDVSSDTSYMKIMTDVTETDPTDRVKIYVLNSEESTSYTVHYDGNGTIDASGTSDVTNVPADQLKLPGTPLTLDGNVPVRPGYTFLGWDPDPAATVATYSPSAQYAIDSDITLYAIWTVAEYDIEYDGNAPMDSVTGLPIGLVNDLPASAKKTHAVDYKIEPDIVSTAVVPSIQGHTTEYTFAGWNTQADGTGISYQPGDIYTTDAPLKLYAQWNFVITYDENVPVDNMGMPMGSVLSDMPYDTNSYKQEIPMNSTTAAIIHDTSLYPNDPVMDNEYTFVEWNTKKDGSGTKYNKDSLYVDLTGTPIKQSVTLYAIWSYKIEYDSNEPVDGMGIPVSVTINNMPTFNPQIEKASSDIAVPATANISSNILTTTPSDYTFAGWNTARDGSGTDYAPGTTYTANESVKLYAQWTYSIKYVANEPLDPTTSLPVGSADHMPNDQNDISTNTNAIIDETSLYGGSAPTLDGYVFVGWDTDPNLDPETATPRYSPDSNYADHKNITLYAIWKEEDLYLRVKDGVDYMITDATIENETRKNVNINYTATTEEQKREYNVGDNYLLGVISQVTSTKNVSPKNEYQKGTTVKELKDNLNTNGIIKVYNVDIDTSTSAENKGSELTDDSRVGTGMYLEITNKLETQKISLRVIVRGNSQYQKVSGIILDDDVQKTYKYISDRASRSSISICSKLACDINLDAIISDDDYQRVKNVRSLRCKFAYKNIIFVTLDAGDGLITSIDGNPTTTKIKVYEGVPYSINGSLPNAEKIGFTFIGWFDKVTGEQITDSTIVKSTDSYQLEARYY